MAVWNTRKAAAAAAKVAKGEDEAPVEAADLPYLGSLRDMPPGLVFIFGCHRSGTTLLYHLLAESGRFNYVTAYDLIKYDELLRNHLQGRTEEVREELDREIRARQADRVVDKLPVGAGLPEEYRFVLAGEVDDPFKQAREMIFAPNLTDATKDKFIELCRKKQLTAEESLPLLLKNPSDFYKNFLAIAGMFPDQKSIIIHRHPLKIINSLVVNWDLIFKDQSHYLSMLDRQYARLFDAPPIARNITRSFLRSAFNARLLVSGMIDGFSYYLQNIGAMPAGSCIELRYEDFCREPGRHLDEIGAFLGTPLELDLAGLSTEPRRQEVLPVIRRAYDRKAKQFAPYLAQLGYDTYPADG